MMTSYSKRIKKIFNFAHVLLGLCGANVLKNDYRMNWLTWSLIGLVNAAIIFTFCTMYVGVAIKHDWSEVLKCLCMFCTGIQAYAKLINAIAADQMFRFLHIEITEMYNSYEELSTTYHKLLEESLRLVMKLIAILLIIVTLTCAAIVGVPFLYKFLYNERTFVMPFLLPYVDYETNFGYCLTTVFHIVCIFFGVMGNFLNDCLCFTFATHIPLMKNILKAKFMELNELLHDAANKENEVNRLLTDIIRWHQKYIVFRNAVKSAFFWVIFVQVAMEFISIVCTIVCIFLRKWPAAPVFLFYSFVLFYFYCALGNLVEISNEDIILMIYECSWYHMTLAQQKLILIMLRESQQAKGMSIGGVAPLTMHIALQLTKTIYTFAMMLKNFLD